MAERRSRKSTSTALTQQLPKEVLANLTDEEKLKLEGLLREGQQVTVVNGKVFVSKKVEKGKIEGWKVGEKLTGIVISVEESAQYANNYIGTFMLADRTLKKKPLNKVLLDMVKAYQDQRDTIFDIECVKLVEGNKFDYYDFDVTVSTPVFGIGAS